MARDYKKEYARYHGKPEQKAKRHAQNMLRYNMKKYGLVSTGDNRTVTTVDGDVTNRDLDNIRIKIKE